MTLQNFLELGKQEQQQAIREKGVKLGEREQTDFKYEIYQLDDFYVEWKLQKPEEAEFLGLQTFETFAELEPYLQVMNIKTG